MKVLASGKIISVVGFKHVVIPVAETAELRKVTQRLASLLPFVRKVEWIESATEFGHDFNQHYTYHPDYAYDFHGFGTIFKLKVKERGVVGPLRRGILIEQLFTMMKEVENEGEREMIGNMLLSMLMKVDEDEDERQVINDQLMSMSIIKEQEECNCSTTIMEVEEDEEDDDDDELTECCSKSGSLLTRLVPRSITRWSLLTELTLKESEIIGNAAQVSILKSLSHDCCKRIKPHIHVKLSFHIQPSTLRKRKWR